MQTKTEFRKELIESRKNFKNKKNLDCLIEQNFISSDYFANSKGLLCYYSTNTEINTHNIIKNALLYGKKVALPKTNDDLSITFYEIDKFEILKPGKFNIMEPKSLKVANLKDFDLCIVPALAYNRYGFRLGYGKGCYDRFLNNYYGKKIGFVYECNIIENLPVDQFDISVDFLITENKIIIT